MGLIALFKETPRPFLAALGLGVTVFSSETDVMTLVSSLEEVDVAGSGFLFPH